MKNPFDYFDAIYCINLDRRTDRWEAVKREFAKIDILDRVIRFSAIETPKNWHIGCILSHRTIIQKAKNEDWKNVLVFEDDVKFVQSREHISKCIAELDKTPFDIFYFGWLFDLRNSPSYQWYINLAKIDHIWCTFSIAYNARFYDTFLWFFPENKPEKFAKNIYFQKYGTIDDTLKSIQTERICLAPKKICCLQRKNPSNIQRYQIPEWHFNVKWIIVRLRLYGIYASYSYMKKYVKKHFSR